jgi:hypothetical protein
VNEDVAIESDADMDLKSEVCSARPADDPTVPVKNSTAPLKRVVPMLREPVRCLPIPLVWEPARESEPIRVLARPLV